MFVTKRLAQMTVGGIAGFLAVLALAGLVAFFWVARTINTAPAQCATCHPELTAMWKRSQGHPADRVSCHECHAQHPSVPESANLGAFVRDQLIPEKYLSSDERIEARCEGCHEDTRASGTGLGVLAAKAALRSAVAALPGVAAEERRVVVRRSALAGDPGPARGEALAGAAARYLRDAEWLEAAAAADAAEAAAVLGEVRSELEALRRAVEGAGVPAAEIARRMGERLGGKVREVQEAMGRIEGVLAGLEQEVQGASPNKRLGAKRAERVRGALDEVSGTLGEVSKARITVGRALKSEQAVADPAELKAALGALGAAVEGATAGEVLAAVQAARVAAGVPLPNPELIAERVSALAAEGEARLSAALARLRESARAALNDLPAGGLPKGGDPVELGPAALVPVAAAEERPGEDAPAPRRPSPGELAAGVLNGVESLAAAVSALGEVEHADLGLDAAAVSTLSERLAKLAAAFPGREGPGAARAALRRSVEEALRFLPQIGAEDRRVLDVAVVLPAPAAGDFVQVDLGDFLPAALAPFERWERGTEKRQVIKANHKVHLVAARDELGKPLGLGCLDCHRNLAHDKAQVETNRPPMSGCFTGECHRKDRNKDNCHRCHYQVLVEPGQEVL